MSRLLRYLLLVIFFTAILVIVFLQFNSNRNIDLLISGNDEILAELDLKNNLQKLSTDLFTLESKIKGIVIKGQPVSKDTLRPDFDSIEKLSLQINRVYDSETAKPNGDFNRLVSEKILADQAILDTFSVKGKKAAEQLIVTNKSRIVTNQIENEARRLDEIHEASARKLIEEADKNGRKAKTMGVIVALIAAAASIFTFLYITFKFREQQILIKQLDDSEKKAREAARIKENFMANMSHEIRTPMNAILGFTNILKRKNLDEESARHVQTIKNSSENLLHIINDILDLSKIEAGMLRIETALFSIRNVIHSVEAMFRSPIEEKGLRFNVTVVDSLPNMLEGDATRLSQILINLLANSLKFTNIGSISLSVKDIDHAGSTVNIGFAVSDTGIGIEEKNLNAIFERFQQAEDSVTRKYGGTGLGLSIVQELVTLQHGEITAQSEAGKGATFSLMIPYKIADEKEESIEKKEVDIPKLDHANVLVAEDNEINQSLVKHLFKEWNVNADFVENGREAIRLLELQKYDLVLMDIQMPLMDGYSTTKEIREKLKSDIPIIAMTAHALEGEREKCLNSGMNDYIAKPIREDELLEKITTYITLTRESRTVNQTAQEKQKLFKVIDLSYMKEISAGNKEYEKLVTGQFIESVPIELAAIKNAWDRNSKTEAGQLAHNLKTTVSIMGLTEKLQKELDAIEYDELSDEAFAGHFNILTGICNESLAEARIFYRTI